MVYDSFFQKAERVSTLQKTHFFFQFAFPPMEKVFKTNAPSYPGPAWVVLQGKSWGLEFRCCPYFLSHFRCTPETKTTVILPV